jgi:hypothetical protein
VALPCSGRLGVLAATASLTLGGLAIFTPTADADPISAAGVDTFTYTTDYNATAAFVSYGDKFGVRDDYADGYRAVGYLEWYGSDGTYYKASVQDANGTGGDFVWNNNHNLPEGAQVWLTACLRNGANGADFRCHTDSRGRA